MAAIPCQPLSKLVFFLVVLPVLLTYLHFSHVLSHNRLLLASSENESFGIFRPVSDTLYRQVNNYATWPSLAHSNIFPIGQHGFSSSLEIRYQDEQNQWCLQRASSSICTLENNQSLTQEPRLYLVFFETKSDVAATAAKTSSSWHVGRDLFRTHKFRPNPNKQKSPQQREHRTLSFVRNKPTTTLFLLVNIGLAFWYWNRHVSHTLVSQSYGALVEQHEYWRAYTSSLAHFDMLHIGFNMMSLYSLGNELEPRFYDSISFLLYNLSLIPLTSLFMVVILYAYQRHSTLTVEARSTQSVGFSAVLFAWMVVASLGKSTTCPIPFMPDVCFSTYHLGSLSINIGPLVQLVMIQMMVRRASFVGHLAGIVAGFMMHWNWLPLEYVQPAVLVPAFWIVVLRVRKVSFVFQQDADPSSSPHRPRRYFNRKFCFVAVWVSTLVTGAFQGYWGSGFMLSQCMTLSLFHAASLSAMQDSSRILVWKAFVVSNIVVILTVSMTLGVWVATTRHLVPDTGKVALGLFSLMLLLLVQLVALCWACWEGTPDASENRVLQHVLGATVLEPARLVAQNAEGVCRRIDRHVVTPFEGHGVALGTQRSAESPRVSRLL